jgi:hypothetical protein
MVSFRPLLALYLSYFHFIVNGKAIFDKEGLGNWLRPNDEQMADVYAIGFQEIGNRN